MTRAQFLNDLYRLLAGNGMDAEQAEQHLVYYAEMLADRMEEGMSEDRAVASMEDVDTIARRILEEEGKVYRPLSEIPTAPPAVPDAAKPGGGKRGYQVPKKWSGKRLAQIALWALAIAVALGAASRWLWMRNVRHSTAVDSPIPVEEMAPYAWEYDEGFVREMPYTEGYQYDGSMASIDADAVSSIDIQWVAGTVYVQSTSENMVEIMEYSTVPLNERTTLHTELTADGELTIRFRDGTSLGNVKGDKWLTVLVPDGMLEELDIETTSAGVQLNGLELGEIDVETTSGEVGVAECYAQKVDVETISGDVNVSNLYADELDVSTTSGDVDGYVCCGDVEIETVSGDANVYSEGAAEQVELSTTSGDMRLTVDDASIRSIAASSTNGNITLSLPWDMGFTLDFSTVSGELINSSFDSVTRDGKILYNGGGCEIEVETVSGNLDIY